LNDVFNGFIGLVIEGLEFAVGPELSIWFVMETAMGERTAESFMEKEEEHGYLNPFGREQVRVTAPSRWSSPWPLSLRRS
jgi:hypothetical protein